MSYLFENHPFDPDFISRFINNEVNDQETIDFMRHLQDCEICENEMHFQLNDKVFSETVDLPHLVEKAKNELGEVKGELSDLTIEEVLNDFSLLSKMSKEFVEENLPEMKIEEFDKNLKDYFFILYDWESGKQKEVSIEESDISALGMGFSKTTKKKMDEFSLLFLMFIGLLRNSYLQHQNNIPKLKKELEKLIKESRLDENLLFKFVEFLGIK